MDLNPAGLVGSWKLRAQGYGKIILIKIEYLRIHLRIFNLSIYELPMGSSDGLIFNFFSN